jgi:hypothetical protein
MKDTALLEPVSMKLTNAQQHYVEISQTKYHPKIKYNFHYANLYGPHNHVIQ